MRGCPLHDSSGTSTSAGRREVAQEVASASTCARFAARSAPQLEQQFVGDPIFAPQHVLPGHRADQLAQLLRDRRPTGAGLHSPEQSPAGAMPANHQRCQGQSKSYFRPCSIYVHLRAAKHKHGALDHESVQGLHLGTGSRRATAHGRCQPSSRFQARTPHLSELPVQNWDHPHKSSSIRSCRGERDGRWVGSTTRSRGRFDHGRRLQPARGL
jgi:hypothetical protein